MQYKYDIAIIGGLGHIGLPLGILFADKFKNVLFLNKTVHFHLMAALKAILHFLGRDCLSYAEMLLRCCLRYNGTKYGF